MWRRLCFLPNYAMAANKRLRQLQKLLNPRIIEFHTGRSDAKSVGSSRVNIDGVQLELNTPSCPELVPRSYLSDSPSQSLLHHLKWMLSKDLIGQDMYLLGPPGPHCRHLALAFAELISREVEHVTITRDTTEVDLKQRREIINSTVTYIDQAVVRAALNGRLLILEGLEKAERNVLPILNNLLENREAQLEDGRFIVAHNRYDQLAKDHTMDQLKSWNLVRASENFRVVAIGLPVPPYQGNTLDPPLRSRFQARHILPLPFPEALNEFKKLYSSIPLESLSSILSMAYTLFSLTQSDSGGPVNITGHLHNLCDILVVTLINYVIISAERDILTSTNLDCIKTQIESIVRILEEEINLADGTLVQLYRKCNTVLRNIYKSTSTCTFLPVNIPTTMILSGEPGRPKIHISVELYELMKEASYTLTEIADTLGTSRTTLWRRLKENNISTKKYSTITDPI